MVEVVRFYGCHFENLNYIVNNLFTTVQFTRYD
jgi:hypothetical protein